MAPQFAPWHDHRAVAKSITEAIAEAVAAEAGGRVGAGKVTSCDPAELVNGRLMPLRAVVVHLGAPLRDVVVFVTSLKEEALRPIVDVATTAIYTSLGLDASTQAWTIDEVVEYEDAATAIDQCDALFLEATFSLDMPTGQLQVVLGTAMLESAAALVAGTVVPVAAEAVATGPVAADAAASAFEAPAAAAPSDAAVDAPALSAIEALDRELAAAEQAAAALAPAEPTGVSAADIVAAPILQDPAASRWTELLHGVDVELSAELGRTNLSLSEITSLHAASVLTLEQMVHEPVTVYVNGTRYATARLVVVDGEYGIEILEVVDQVQLAPRLAA